MPRKSLLSRGATELRRRVAPRLAPNDATYMARATFWAKPPEEEVAYGTHSEPLSRISYHSTFAHFTAAALMRSKSFCVRAK